MTLAPYIKKRRLERAGFVHLSGWVRNEDAPPIRLALQRGDADAEAALGDWGKE
jgi:hypothetical protein